MSVQKKPGMTRVFLKRMNDLLFKRFLAVAMLVILLIASVMMSYSEDFVPEEKDWNYRQLQEIDSTQENFSFAVFGDNKNSIKIFENLIESVNEKNVTFAIACGDMVFSGKEAQYKFFIDQVKNFDIPLLTVAGIHDVEAGGREFYYEYFGAFYYPFTIGNSYFIIMDDANGKNIDSMQMVWLKDELRKSQDFEKRFVFMHVPLFDPREGREGMDGREGREGSLEVGHSLSNLSFANDLNDLFDENNVTMLFCSHIHGYFRGTWGKTPYIITGGAGAKLSGSDEEHYFNHYIRVNVSQDGVEYEVMKLDGLDHVLLGRGAYHVWIDMYAFFTIYFWESLMGMSMLYLGFYVLSLKFELVMKKIGFPGMEASK